MDAFTQHPPTDLKFVNWHPRCQTIDSDYGWLFAIVIAIEPNGLWGDVQPGSLSGYQLETRAEVKTVEVMR